MKNSLTAENKNLGAPTKEEYQKVVDSASLRDIRLMDSEFSTSPEVFGRPEKGWKHGYGCEVEKSFYDEDGKLLSGWVSASAYIKNGRKRVMQLKCRYLVLYGVDGTPSDATVSKFIERLGVFAAYPYFRAHFADTVAQAGLRLPPLPIIKDGKHRLKED